MGISIALSKHVKVFLTGIALIAMCIGIGGIWGYAGPETVGKALGTMALIAATVFVIDGVIYAKLESNETLIADTKAKSQPDPVIPPRKAI